MTESPAREVRTNDFLALNGVDEDDPLATHCEMEDRHSTERMATLDEPDNELHTKVGESNVKVNQEASFELSSALRTPMFWALVAGGCSVEMYWCGLNFHLLRVLQSGEADLTSTQIAHVQTITSICAMVASVVAGVAIDYVERKQMLLVGGLACGAASIVLLLNCTSVYQAWLFGALFGVMAGPSVG